MQKFIGERGSGKTEKMIQAILEAVSDEKLYVIVCSNPDKMLMRIQEKNVVPSNFEVISYESYLIADKSANKEYYIDDVEELLSYLPNVRAFGLSI